MTNRNRSSPESAHHDPNSCDPPSPSNTAKGHAHLDFESLPSLYRDRAFWGMTVTQFLGAFNDSVFKQILLLLTVEVVVTASSKPIDLQWLANQIFSIPFVLLSGTAGFWADRVSKRSIVVLCKVAEFAVMLSGTLAFRAYTGGVPWGLLCVLFFMGAQSAVFGPAKYGILPEMVRARDLPRFNGIIQMTTFIALILGIPLAGSLVHRLGQDRLWIAGCFCMGVALVGTLTSLLVRRTPIAHPAARFSWQSVAVSRETWEMLKADAPLRMALLVYCLFWFVAAVVPLATNAVGIRQLGLNEEDTSLMLACVAIGIAVGCALAGWLSAERVSFRLVRIGAWGICLGLLLLAIVPAAGFSTAVAYRGCQLVLGAAGVFTGLLAVPLQVFLQSRPPDEQKGRVIGTMNLVNWIGIILSGVYYLLCQIVMDRFGFPPSGTFAITAVLLLPVAWAYHPEDAVL
jgi:acyl-[acyl-carrier-protein]-phospholipid O-acyltransferase/long-chain-fatty-acid--[acyl-carrier-protein] ligase